MEKNLFEALLATLSRYRGRFVKGFLMVLAGNSLLILNPLVFREAVMALDPQSSQQGGTLAPLFRFLFGEHVSSVWVWASTLMVIALVSALFKYAMRMTFIGVSREAEVEVRSKLFDHIQGQSMAFFDKYGIGELLSRLTNDITAYRDVLGPGIMYPLFFLTLAIPGFTALFLISKTLTLFAFVPLFVIPLVNFAIRGRLYALSTVVQRTLGWLSSMVQEHFSSIRILKSYGIEGAMAKRFSRLCQTLFSSNLWLDTFEGALYPFFTLLTKIITVALVLFSGIIILQEWSVFNTADFVSFMWIQSYIFFPVLMLGWLIPVYQRGRAAYDRLLEIYNEPVEVRDNAASTLRIPPGAAIELRGLTFAYPGAAMPALSDVSLLIPGGSFVGITGPVGGGKTTLLRLLTREYEIGDEKIFIGGKDIHAYPLRAFHSEIVTVEQVPFLFSRSIAENVRFGRESATQKEVELVARFADFHETVLEFPEQYDTIVGERGVTLSGGQRQRLAMARAFLVNRSILLLDDIFSAIDSSTEQRIFQAMRQNLLGKTVILISQRVSVLEHMDRILYVVNGRIVEDGTHEQLMRHKGQYAALVELQRLRRGK